MKRKADWNPDPKYQNENYTKTSNDKEETPSGIESQTEEKPKITARRITEQTKDLDINKDFPETSIFNSQHHGTTPLFSGECSKPLFPSSQNLNQLGIAHNTNPFAAAASAFPTNCTTPQANSGTPNPTLNPFLKAEKANTALSDSAPSGNPFQAFHSSTANPFAVCNPFLGNPTLPNAQHSQDQPNKSFGDFFKNQGGDGDEESLHSNPEEENEWTRNMNPDLKYTAKSSVKSAHDQLQYKGAHVCITKCLAKKYKTRSESDEILKLGTGIITIEILPDTFNILFVYRLKGNLIVSIMGYYNEKCICKKSNLKEGKAYQLINIFELEKKTYKKLFIKFESEGEREEFENRLTQARLVAQKFKTGEYRYQDYQGSYFDTDNVSQVHSTADDDNHQNQD